VAKQVVVVDDLTGEVGARSRHICLDGVEYEIDLTDESFTRLKDALRPYLETARVVDSGRKGSGTRGTPVRKPQMLPSSSSTIRAWAASRGLACPARGRIPRAVVDAYVEAQG
jgi:hypothetical protein